MDGWRERAGTTFGTYKEPAVASRGMVVANHPMGAAAGLEMLTMGGNARRCCHCRHLDLECGGADDGWSVRRGLHKPTNRRGRIAVHRQLHDSTFWGHIRHVPTGVGPLARVSPHRGPREPDRSPGGRCSWQPEGVGRGSFGLWSASMGSGSRTCNSIREARLPGFGVLGTTHQRSSGGSSAVRGDGRDIFLPNGSAPLAGDLIIRSEYADSLTAIATGRSGELYGGPLGHVIADDMAANGGLITIEDLREYTTIHTDPVRGTYRGHEISGPPPGEFRGHAHHRDPQHSRRLRRSRPRIRHHRRITPHCRSAQDCFADRFEYLGDPATVDIPLDWITSKSYATSRRADIDMSRATPQHTGTPHAESSYTTHVTAADADGAMVSMTQTLNELFGSKVTVPGTGVLLNNTQALFDPHPGNPNSITANKRAVSSMAPTIVSKDGRAWLGMGAPGGVRIFGSVLQAIVNIVDHGMTLQEAVEAPRIWTQGQELQVEATFGADVRDGLGALGHHVTRVSNVAGGMNGIMIDAERGYLTGAACWRADGAPAGLSGGPADSAARFNPLL